MLEKYIKNRLEQKDILLMTHIVIGYPDIETSYQIVKTMVESGVDMMELQIPFSEPIADGPVILHANQISLANNISIAECFNFAEKITRDFNIPFLIMSYLNVMFKFGVDSFCLKMKNLGIKGAIIPDLPLEESSVYTQAMQQNQLDPIFLYSPSTPFERMQSIAESSQGFIYCVARKGVTGQKTDFAQTLEQYLKQCRRATDLPLALGFGVKEKKDIYFLKNKAEIAVIGTQAIRVFNQKGTKALGNFLSSLLN